MLLNPDVVVTLLRSVPISIILHGIDLTHFVATRTASYKGWIYLRRGEGGKAVCGLLLAEQSGGFID